MRQATAKARRAKKRTAIKIEKARAVKDRKEKRAKGAAGRPGPGRGKKKALPTRKDVLEEPTLAQLGISPKESHEAQAFAKLPEPLKQAVIGLQEGSGKIEKTLAVKGNPITVSFQGEPVGRAWDFDDELIRGWAKLIAAQFPRKAGRPRKYNREQVIKVLAVNYMSEAARILKIRYNALRAFVSDNKLPHKKLPHRR